MIVGPVQLDIVNARSLKSLRSGSFLLFRVVRSKGNGTYSVILKGEMFDVKSKIPLKSGSKYRARVVRTGGGIRFRILDDLTFEDKVLKNHSYSDPDLVREISRSLINTGLAATESNVKAVSKGLSLSGKKDSFLVKLLAVMLDKDIPLTEETILPLTGYSGDYRNSGRDGDREKDDSRNNGENRKILDEDGSELKSYILRGDDDKSFIKYFNHRRGRHGNWFIIPIVYNNDKAGVLRLNTGPGPGGSLEGLSISFYGKSHWEISAFRTGGSYSMKVYTNHLSPERLMKDKLVELKEKLRKKGMEIDDIKREESPSGGFGKVFDTRKGIDEVV